MQFFGKKFTILEQKYSKETIGTIFMFSACIIFIFPTLYLKCNKNVNISYALLVRGFSGIIGFTIMAAIKEKQLVKFCR